MLVLHNINSSLCLKCVDLLMTPTVQRQETPWAWEVRDMVEWRSTLNHHWHPQFHQSSQHQWPIFRCSSFLRGGERYTWSRVGRQKIKEAFICDYLQMGSSNAGFFDPVKRKCLKTMEAWQKPVKLTSSEGNVNRAHHYNLTSLILTCDISSIPYKVLSNCSLHFLRLWGSMNRETLPSQSQCLDEPPPFDVHIHYSLFPVPPSLGAPDGFLPITDKAPIWTSSWMIPWRG